MHHHLLQNFQYLDLLPGKNLNMFSVPFYDSFIQKKFAILPWITRFGVSDNEVMMIRFAGQSYAKAITLKLLWQ